MGRILIAILVLLFLGSCVTPTVINEEESTDHILNLENGFLLVRLRNVDKQIAILRQRRQRTEANRLKLRTKKENAKTLRAFRDHFDHCPVYFFYSHHSRRIREMRLDSVILDRELLPAPRELWEGKKFLAAEFANIQPPADGAGLPALIVMDQNLKQLKDPFPYYVRTTILGEENREEDAVKLLNDNLKVFYEDTMKKKQKQPQQQ